MKLNFFALLFSVLLISTSHAASLRRCLVLPITDNVGGAVSYKVFEGVEDYLKNSKWCYYRYNSGLMDILSGYRNNIHKMIRTKDVLQLLSQKSGAGSIIRIDIKEQPEGTLLNLEVVDESGEDIIYHEKKLHQKSSPSNITESVINLLENYRLKIPYDGKVKGMLGDQLTFDIGLETGISKRDKVTILRFTRKKKHPLLKQVVSWETQEIAEGIVSHVTLTQSEAKITVKKSELKIRKGDWIILKKEEVELDRDEELKVDPAYKFGKLGAADAGLSLALVNLSTSNGTLNKSSTGFSIQAYADAEVWITRNIWSALYIERGYGTALPGDEFNTDSGAISNYTTRMKVGYKYLPLGFFYGPRIDFYGGYGWAGFDIDTNQTDLLAPVDFSGLLLGVRGVVPFKSVFELNISMDFILSPSVETETNVFTSPFKSGEYYEFNFGAYYLKSPTFRYFGMIKIRKQKAEFKDPTQLISVNTFGVSAGVNIVF